MKTITVPFLGMFHLPIKTFPNLEPFTYLNEKAPKLGMFYLYLKTPMRSLAQERPVLSRAWVSASRETASSYLVIPLNILVQSVHLLRDSMYFWIPRIYSLMLLDSFQIHNRVHFLPSIDIILTPHDLIHQ